jgi:hypothetical protein
MPARNGFGGISQPWIGCRTDRRPPEAATGSQARLNPPNCPGNQWNRRRRGSVTSMDSSIFRAGRQEQNEHSSVFLDQAFAASSGLTGPAPGDRAPMATGLRWNTMSASQAGSTPYPLWPSPSRTVAYGSAAASGCAAHRRAGCAAMRATPRHGASVAPAHDLVQPMRSGRARLPSRRSPAWVFPLGPACRRTPTCTGRRR